MYVYMCLVALLCLTLNHWGFSRQEYWSALPCPPPGCMCVCVCVWGGGWVYTYIANISPRIQ